MKLGCSAVRRAKAASGLAIIQAIQYTPIKVTLFSFALVLVGYRTLFNAIHCFTDADATHYSSPGVRNRVTQSILA